MIPQCRGWVDVGEGHLRHDHSGMGWKNVRSLKETRCMCVCGGGLEMTTINQDGDRRERGGGKGRKGGGRERGREGEERRGRERGGEGERRDGGREREGKGERERCTTTQGEGLEGRGEVEEDMDDHSELGWHSWREGGGEGGWQDTHTITLNSREEGVHAISHRFGGEVRGLGKRREEKQRPGETKTHTIPARRPQYRLRGVSYS